MRIPSNLFKGLAFIGAVAARDALGNPQGDILGTGFFVKVPSARFSPPASYVYLVTAKHVVDDIGDSEPYILATGMDGTAKQLTHIGEKWWAHPSDDSADVIVRQVAFQPNLVHLAINVKDFVLPDSIKKGEVVEGDETFMAGYFSPISSTRNLPIVRHGNVAMLPSEQIQTEYGYADVYLVEARSIGGISGSPVFVRPPLRYGIEMPKGTTALFDAIGQFKLLGVMHGHWDIKESRMNEHEVIHDRKHGVNMGIGIVVPAVKLLETLNQPGLEKLRQLGDEDLARTNKAIPGMDSAKCPDKPRDVITQEDFQSALTKATRKTSEKK